MVRSPKRRIAYRFDRFRLELKRGVLLCEGDERPLRPKSFALLSYLVAHPGRLLSRDELLEAVWPDRVVSEDSLTQCLVEIRRALDDDDKRILRTVPKRGVLLDTPVEVADPVSGAVRSRLARAFGMFSRRPIAVALLLVLTVAIPVLLTMLRGSHTDTLQSAAPVPTMTIAVLPFADLSPEGTHR